jgi:Tol biopolymer transport system component
MDAGNELIALWRRGFQALEDLERGLQKKANGTSVTHSVQQTAQLLAANMLLLDGEIAPEQEAFIRAVFGFTEDSFDYYIDELEKIRSESLRFLEEVPPILESAIRAERTTGIEVAAGIAQTLDFMAQCAVAADSRLDAREIWAYTLFTETLRRALEKAGIQPKPHIAVFKTLPVGSAEPADRSKPAATPKPAKSPIEHRDPRQARRRSLQRQLSQVRHAGPRVLARPARRPADRLRGIPLGLQRLQLDRHRRGSACTGADVTGMQAANGGHMRGSHRALPEHSVWAGALVTLLVAGCTSSAEPPDSVEGLRLEALTETRLTGTVGTGVTPVPTVRLMTSGGSPVSGIEIRFQVAGGGSIAIAAQQTDTAGLASPGAWVLGTAPGAKTLTARAGEAPEVVFTATALPGPAAEITSVSGNDQLASAGESLSKPLLALLADSFGNPVPGAPVTFTAIAGGGSIDGHAVVTDSNGIAASGPWRLGAEAGVQEVSATSGPAQVDFRAFAVARPSGLQGQIAFVSLTDSGSDIAVVNGDGSGLKRLPHPGLDLQPAWSPDGSRIAFVNDGQIYVMRPDGTNLSRLTNGGDPAWSPDGAAIAFSSLRGELWHVAALSPASGAVTVLTTWPDFEGQLSWSADGRQLAFVRVYDFFSDFVPDIYTMNADGTGQTRRTQGIDLWPSIRHSLHPAWSPDGSMIAFVLGRVINLSGDAMRYTVTLMSADGVFLKDLAWAGDIAWNEAFDPGSLTWSLDGYYIAYSFVDCDLAPGQGCSGARSVKYVSIDGSREGTIVSNAHSPSWRR